MLNSFWKAWWKMVPMPVIIYSPPTWKWNRWRALNLPIGKGNKTSRVGYIYDSGFIDLSSLEFPKGVNLSGDVVGRGYPARAVLEHADHGTIPLDANVVLFANDDDRDLWDVNADVLLASERGMGGSGTAADFPVIAGAVGYSDDRELFFLIPVPVPEP